MKKSYIYLIAMFVANWSIGQSYSPCLPEGITFTTQEQIDNFQNNYPGCTEIEGDVFITDHLITNLNGLSIITKIGGGLMIHSINSLVDLTGLNNLTEIGGNLHIGGTSLTSLTGLNSLVSISGDFLLGFGGPPFYFHNSNLTSLAALESLISIGGSLQIFANYSLKSLDGLNGITEVPNDLSISTNDSLTSITGLDNVASIGGNLIIRENSSLSGMTGFENVTSIGGVLQIITNHNLINLVGIDNIDHGGIVQLKIIDNILLSECDVQSICDYLLSPNGSIEIHDNAPGCNSQAEVGAACLTTVKEIKTGNKISIIPNPSNDKITISSTALTDNTELLIFNVSGVKVMECPLTENETQIDISALPRGVYFVRLQNEKMVEVGKVIKE